jgi:hypothetical protein
MQPEKQVIIMDKERLILDKKINIKDFNDFYWLKSELMSFCREIGISSSGGKIEIANRISEYLETGKVAENISDKMLQFSCPISTTIISIIPAETSSISENFYLFKIFNIS